jgi:Bacterial regulatory helix-turn-helix protein, lysR family
METQHVRYFLAICNELNFTRAAKECGIAQPSLTTAIQRMEREIGGALFLRSTRAPRVQSSQLERELPNGRFGPQERRYTLRYIEGAATLLAPSASVLISVEATR